LDFKGTDEELSDIAGTFVVNETHFGETFESELIQGGSQIYVTKDNRE
jgi:hypothetical protein